DVHSANPFAASYDRHIEGILSPPTFGPVSESSCLESFLCVFAAAKAKTSVVPMRPVMMRANVRASLIRIGPAIGIGMQRPRAAIGLAVAVALGGCIGPVIGKTLRK